MPLAALIIALVATVVASGGLYVALRAERRAEATGSVVGKLNTLPLEWEVALKKMASLAGRVDKNTALLRETEEKTPESAPPNGAGENHKAPAPALLAPRSRLELLSRR